MADLLVISFPTEAQAEEARTRVASMQREYLIELGDAVVALRKPDGSIKLNQTFHPTAAGAAGGLASAGGQAAADVFDESVGKAQVPVELAAFVDEAGIDDERGGHGVSYSGGTGSCPPGCRGWQRPMRRAASQPPLIAPKRPIASIAYSEQLGTNRQRVPSRGLIQRL